INFLTAPDYPSEQAQGNWFFVTHGGPRGNDFETFYAHIFPGSNFSRAILYDFEMRFTEDALESGMGYRRFLDRAIMPVPFELWNLGELPNDASDDFRMLPAILNGSELGEGADDIDVWDFWGDDHSSGSNNDPSSDWTYWGNPVDQTPGQAGYNSFFASGVGTVADDSNNWIEVMAATRLMNWNAYVSHTGSIALTALSSPDPLNWTAADTALFIAEGFFLDTLNSDGVVEVEGNNAVGTILDMPEVGTVFRWITNKPNGLGDLYTFSTLGYEPDVLAFDKNNIKVWPNPYFGYNPEEVRLDEHRIHFINLPDEATIRIITLAGQTLKVIEHSGSQEAVWDVRNGSNVLVASGVYIAIVDTEYGQEVLKLAVVARPF
ncbi:MAG: T9SS type A sorting domain-containing protein, partial [Candidatus Marinimicrobia bacterium]|nr:T9SS type A sorting domain-containing protein [Candidatus Neomarinimicrobiota bacterium]